MIPLISLLLWNYISHYNLIKLKLYYKNENINYISIIFYIFYIFYIQLYFNYIFYILYIHLTNRTLANTELNEINADD